MGLCIVKNEIGFNNKVSVFSYYKNYKILMCNVFFNYGKYCKEYRL